MNHYYDLTMIVNNYRLFSPDEVKKEQNIHGIWVQFYKRAKRHLFMLEDKSFFVCWEDIIRKHEEPLLTMCGSRIYYKF